MLVDTKISVSYEMEQFAQSYPTAGGIVSFIGQVRANSLEDPVEALFLQAHPNLTQSAIETKRLEISSTVDIESLVVKHRIGLIPFGETILVVMAAAKHRRAAFTAVDQMMDYLKTEAIFWKREDRLSGSTWIEPRQEDYKDASRWLNLV